MLGFLCYFLGDHVVWATSVGLLSDAVRRRARYHAA